MILAIDDRPRSTEELEAIRRAVLAFEYYNSLYPAVLNVKTLAFPKDSR